MQFLKFSTLILASLAISLSEICAEAGAARAPQAAAWAGFVEPDFPFFSSVLDARDLGAEWPGDNLTPRGLILNLGNGCWACFDTELLRMSAIWEGQGVTPAAMSQGSYLQAGHKAPDGQEALPRIAGIPWVANGIYPGWQAGELPILADPREPGPDPREIGRGPLPERLGRFKAIRLTRDGVGLEYEIGKTAVREWVTVGMVNDSRRIVRHFALGAVDRRLWLMLGHKSSGVSQDVEINPSAYSVGGTIRKIEQPNGCIAIQIEPSHHAEEFSVVFGRSPAYELLGAPAFLSATNLAEHHAGRDAGAPSGVRWPQVVTTRATLSQATNAYVLDNIPLPLEIPWKRNVRLADIAFFRDGRAAAVTFDGDVWLLTGLGRNLGTVQWRRFASGLHEPLSLCIRDEQMFVFDRNGIWRLRDTNGDGEADVYVLFSNAFAQTAESREFANGMKLAPDSSFIIAKGGQQSSTLGKHNGSVLRVSPDGKTATVLGWGLRQPFVGVYFMIGLVIVSDQQGYYVFATFLHIIRDR